MKHCRLLLLYLLLLLPAFCKAQIATDSIIAFNETSTSEMIADRVYILLDSSHNLAINDVVTAPGFVRSTSNVPNLGVTQHTYWLRFTIRNASDYSRMALEIENPLLTQLVLYTPDGTGGFQQKVYSKYFPFDNRKNNSQNYLFILKQDQGAVRTYYLKVNSNTQMLIPMKLGKYESIAESDVNRGLFSALYLGIMLVMFLYNLFVLLSTRDRSYLYYILYILSVSLVQLNVTGLGFKYIWSDYPAFERFSVYLFPSLTALTSIGFIRSFLDTKTYVPKLTKGFWIFVIAYLFTLVSALWGNKLLAYNLLNINALPLALYMIAIAAHLRIRHKSRPALFFLIAWTVFLSSIMIFVLKDFGVFPYNLFTVSVIQIGSAIEVVLLSIALADRINTLKKEKEKSQAEVLEAVMENERIVREQNVILEAKVDARTIELTNTNQSLNKAMTDLKEAESHLVESEKMASLGQLTAGIAHEINNPINFVTSNINPLKRDVQILLDTIITIENVGLSDAPLAEKQQQINNYKEEIDYDYLKTEISYLLKGINEGATRTAEIVKGLRVFSRLDEDSLKQAEMNEGLDSTLIIINNMLNSRIEVVKNYGNLPLIECYPGKLNQVFLNMISNAIHAINKRWGENKGGILTITTLNDENYVYIKIKDNGTGMSEQTKKRLFEPFYTTKDVGEGTGLGLSIAWNTINKHNGQIHLDSTIGDGTEFAIQLPIHQE